MDIDKKTHTKGDFFFCVFHQSGLYLQYIIFSFVLSHSISLCFTYFIIHSFLQAWQLTQTSACSGWLFVPYTDGDVCSKGASVKIAYKTANKRKPSDLFHVNEQYLKNNWEKIISHDVAAADVCEAEWSTWMFARGWELLLCKDGHRAQINETF